ncbi:MAG: hypothetical protein ABFD62_04725, partial [Syntrophaceae bacterium]
VFRLEDYLKQADEFANCYDQAAAIQALSGAIGVKLQWIFMNTFGFINTTNLLGYGDCNNPFFDMDGTEQTIDKNDRNRTAFGNHAFCALREKVQDACAGPHSGRSKTVYVTMSIDTTTILYRLFRMRPGNVADMSNYNGVIGFR